MKVSVAEWSRSQFKYFTGSALEFENHVAKVTYIVSKLGSCLAHEVKISKIHGAIAPPAPP